MRKLLILCFTVLASAQTLAEDAMLAKRFKDINGTIVISSLHSGQTFVHNDSRANRRFSPASTFKILNTLIALEEKAIAGKDDLLKWDGTTREFPDWNRDHTLESAFKVSCVWCFQELARRIGAEKYQAYLTESDYGELSKPFQATTFWLDGSLKISAAEQVAFLKKVYQRALPFSPSAYQTLQEIMLVEHTPAFTLRAKTGWATEPKPQIGWYVGYVETPKEVWFFAMNMNIHDAKELPLRQKLTLEALRSKGIIE